MPRPFSDTEQARIRESLRKAGRKLFVRNGVAGTTVDEVARAAGIAKGSFYKFYKSKELLFFGLLEDTQETMRAPLLAASEIPRTRERFELLLRTLIERVCHDPLIQFMGREEDFQAVMLRVPGERLRRHLRNDQEFLDALIALWANPGAPPKRDIVAARLTMALLICLRRDFIGERLFPLAIDAAVESLADCIFGRPAGAPGKL